MKKYLGFFVFFFIVGSAILSYFLWKPHSSNPDKIELSSMDDPAATEAIVSEDINKTNYDYINRLSDAELLSYLEKSPLIQAKDDSYNVSSEEMANEYQEIITGQNVAKADFSYETIGDDPIKFEFEDPAMCKQSKGRDRLFYEKQLLNPKIKDLVQMRSEESKKLPMKCITHIMNKFGVSPINYAVCAKASGMPRVPGGKPCVSEKLVAATYNSFIDVTECLNLNPKDLLPKIYNESGFFLNTYGSGKDAGIGQLTGVAIEEVNKYYTRYLDEMEMAAANKPACARVMAHKAMLAKVPHTVAQRCSLIGIPENPLKNIVYLSILNRISMDYLSGVVYKAGLDYFQRKDGMLEAVKYDPTDQFEGYFQKENYRAKLIQLGIKNPNMHVYKDILTYAGYNMGMPTSIRLFSEYLQKRIAAKKPLTTSDFDFINIKMATDIDGKSRSVVDIARLNIMSSFIGAKDTPEVKLMKVKRRKELPKIWATAYLKSFPEYLTYRANEYDGKVLGGYQVYGTPGYLNIVTGKNKILRDTFQSAGIDPNYCSNPDYLKVK